MKLLFAAAGCILVSIAPPALAADTAFPPDFRGHVSYSGSYNGKVFPQSNSSTNIRTHGISLKLPGLDSVLGLNAKPISGNFTVELELNGPSASLTIRSTGGLNPIAAKGTRQGTQCVFPADTGNLTAYCGSDGFNVHYTSANNVRQKITFSGQGAATKIVDRAQLEALARAEAARRQGEYQAYINGMPPAKRSKAILFVNTLEADSRGWFMNRLDPYSVRDVSVTPAGKGEYDISGNYTYNGGSQGWMKAHAKGQSIECVEFFDFPGQCRAIGQSPGQGIGMGMIGSLLSGAMSGGSSSGSSSNQGACGASKQECERRQEQSYNDMYKQAPVEPVRPIDPFYGNGPG